DLHDLPRLRPLLVDAEHGVRPAIEDEVLTRVVRLLKADGLAELSRDVRGDSADRLEHVRGARMRLRRQQGHCDSDSDVIWDSGFGICGDSWAVIGVTWMICATNPLLTNHIKSRIPNPKSHLRQYFA